MDFEYFASIVLMPRNGAKSRLSASKMSFVPYGFLEGGKPVEGFFIKNKTYFTEKFTLHDKNIKS